MTPRSNSTSKFNVARTGFLDEEALNFMELNLVRKFGDSSRPKSLSLSTKTTSGSKWFQSSKSSEKPSRTNPANLRLDIRKAKKAPLPKLAITIQPEAPIIELSLEHLKIPTKEELEKRRRSGMVKKDLQNKKCSPQMFVQREAPPIPKATSASASRKRIEEFKKKLKGIKLDNIKNIETSNKLNSQRSINVIKETGGSVSSHSTSPLQQSTVFLDIPVSHAKPQGLHPSRQQSFWRDNCEQSGAADFDFQDFLLASTASEALENPSLLRYRQSRRNRNQFPSSCIFCNLDMGLMYSLNNGERLIKLKCDHQAHEQCITMEVELNDNFKIDTNEGKELAFPNCSICKEKAFPADPSELNTILETAIFNRIKNRAHEVVPPLSPSLNISRPGNMINLKELKHNNSLVKPIDLNEKPTLEVKEKVDFLGIPSRSPKRSADIPPKQYEIVDISPEHKSKSNSGHKKRQSRASVATGVPLIVSSATEYKIPESLKNKTNWTTKYSVHLLSKKLENDLIKLSQDGTINPVEVANFVTMYSTLESFGEIRVADKMLVKGMNDDKYSECYCFLFGFAILIFQIESLTFTVMNINYLTMCELDEKDILCIKPSRQDEVTLRLDSQMDYLTRKWEIAITIPSMFFDNSVITNTIKEDEFDYLFKSNSSTVKAKTEFKKLLTGVDPRFYISIINNINITHKPERIVLILNQFPYATSTTLAMKNIICALHMIKIDIDLILTSSKFMKLDSCIISHHQLLATGSDDELTSFVEIIENFESTFYEDKDDYEPNLDTFENTIVNIINQNKGTSIEDIHTILLSNTGLKNIGPLPTKKNIMVEIGLLNENKSFRSNVIDLSDWEDVMEVICNSCSLEFDEDDFEFSDVESSGFDILRDDASVISSVGDDIPSDTNEQLLSDGFLQNNRTMSLKLSSQIQIDSPTSSFKKILMDDKEENSSYERLDEIIGKLDVELEKYSDSV